MTLLLSILSFSVAMADDSQDLAKSCMDRYKSQAAVAACMSEPRFAQIEAVQAEIGERLDEAQATDVEILARLADVSDSVARLARERIASTSAVPAPVPVPPARTTFAVVGGASYQTVSRPSLVSIYKIPEADTLHVTALDEKASRDRCGGTSTARVIVMNHGIPTPVWTPPGVPSGFIEVYADLDGDGEPDATPYKVIDPSRQSGFYVTWRSGDAPTFTYLRESGKVIAVSGLPLQTVWRKPKPGDNGPLHCRPGSASSPGGNREIYAASLWRDW